MADAFKQLKLASSGVGKHGTLCGSERALGGVKTNTTAQVGQRYVLGEPVLVKVGLGKNLFKLVIANTPALLRRTDANGFQSPIERRRQITVNGLRAGNQRRFIEQFVGDVGPQMDIFPSRTCELAALRRVGQEDQGLDVRRATFLKGLSSKYSRAPSRQIQVCESPPTSPGRLLISTRKRL